MFIDHKKRGHHCKMKRYHPIVIVVWIGLSLFVMFLSHKLGLGKLRNPGPGLMPFVLGGLFFVSSACLLIVEFVRGSVEDIPMKEQKEINTKKIILVTVALTLYGLLLEKIGFPVSTFLLLFLLFRFMTLKWITSLVSSAVTVAVTYVSFTYLGVRLPSGIFRTLGF
jgi:putative tricarboxylic transport membrane protein